MYETNSTIEDCIKDLSLCNSNIQQRHRTTPTQSQFLDGFPDLNMRKNRKSVYVWFQNRRAKRNKKNLSRTSSKYFNTAKSSTDFTNSIIISNNWSRNSRFPITAAAARFINDALLKLPPLRNLVEECDKLRTRGTQLSVNVTLPSMRWLVISVRYLFLFDLTNEHHV
ncbi:hypothetical protein RIR_jg24144.t1 [Rhizophagus irregularis DAOM 181602=DAOM 197198]|nr:hypothetical protein RIR_jg24144.t1 [Rhizophagus irregularis DAOM 181602=DAOM 197198]